jgi:hypothetical protein
MNSLSPSEQRYIDAGFEYWKICWDWLSEENKASLRIAAEFMIWIQGHSRLAVENLLNSKISSPYLPEAIKCYHMLSAEWKALIMDKIRRYSWIFSGK